MDEVEQGALYEASLEKQVPVTYAAIIDRFVDLAMFGPT